MKKFLSALAILLGGLASVEAASVSLPSVTFAAGPIINMGGGGGGGGSGFQLPGPSAALFASPYYTCVRNFYVAATGNDANNGTSAGTPWLTIAHYDSATGTAPTPAAGDCVNVAAGTYANGNNDLKSGGSSATSTGYIVYRCQTLNGCTITNAGAPGGVFSAGSTSPSGNRYPDYLIFDGFVLNASSGQSSADASGINCINGDATPAANNQCHHWWVINNIISFMGQSGVQLNDSEYFYVFHNTIFQTSHDCQAAQGSGVSLATLAQIFGGYSPTADDSSNATMGIYTSGIHAMVSFNVIYNPYIGCTTPGGNTDGNGIILDQNSNAGGVYTPVTLFSFNVLYNMGGNGIHLFDSNEKNAIVANNSCYNPALDLFNNGTARYCLGDNASLGSNTFVNNLVKVIPGASGVTSFNIAVGLWEPNDVGLNNITKCTITPPGTGDCNQVFNGNTFSCVNNKCNTDPLWVDVGSVSPGTESTQPNGVNFALQVTSPAIGYLSSTAAAYLPPATRDAGACDHSFTTCP